MAISSFNQKNDSKCINAPDEMIESRTQQSIARFTGCALAYICRNGSKVPGDWKPLQSSTTQTSNSDETVD